MSERDLMFWNSYAENPSSPSFNMMTREEFFDKYMCEEFKLVDTSEKITEIWKKIGENMIWYSPTESVEFGFIGKRGNFVFVDVSKMHWLTVEEIKDANKNGVIMLENILYTRGLITADERDSGNWEIRIYDNSYQTNTGNCETRYMGNGRWRDFENISELSDTAQCHYFASQCGWDPDE